MRAILPDKNEGAKPKLGMRFRHDVTARRYCSNQVERRHGRSLDAPQAALRRADFSIFQ